MRTKLDYRSLGESKGTYSNSAKASQGNTSNKSSQSYSSYGTDSDTNSSIRGRNRKPISGSSSARSSKNRSSQKGSSGASTVAFGLLAGAGVGVLAGILMAPDSGKTTRRRLSDSAAWVGRGITEKFQNSKGKVDSWIGKAEDNMKDATSGKRNEM